MGNRKIPSTVLLGSMDIYAKVKYNKPEELFEVVNDALHQRGF